MSDEKHCAVRLSGREAMYLRNATFLPYDLSRIVGAAENSENNGIVILLPRDASERFREIFTERLAKVGFDDDYKPTSEGKVLEALIDHFYIK